MVPFKLNRLPFTHNQGSFQKHIDDLSFKTCLPTTMTICHFSAILVDLLAIGHSNLGQSEPYRLFCINLVLYNISK